MPKISKRKFLLNIILFLAFFGVTVYLVKKNSDLLPYASSKLISIENLRSDTRNTYIDTYPRIVLQDLWSSYVDDFIQNDGRTIDKSSDLITTSEGQSYSLLKAVWVDDRASFDKVWKWTNVNLKKRPNDSLFAWKWGKRDNGDWGILIDDGGLNTASDADQDIALALILAYNKWNDEYYLNQATTILNDIWNNEVVIINNTPYITAGNWANQSDNIIVNPSYFSFGAYPLFKKYDPAHDWDKVKDSSYVVLNELTSKLPPDWASVSKSNQKAVPIGLNGKAIGFSQDALRIPWRVALDWKWNHDDRAMAYLKKLDTLQEAWQTTGNIKEQYTLGGKPVTFTDSLSMYGSLLPYMQIVSPKDASTLLSSKISPGFNQDTGEWRKSLGYYESNWLWFGLALYLDNGSILLPERQASR